MNILFMNSARAWGGNEKWVKLAATALKNNHNVFLAYRNAVVGSRIPVNKLCLPFRHEADLQTILQLIAFVKKHDIDVLIPSKRKEYVIAGIVRKACRCLNILRLGIVRDLKNNPLQRYIFNRLADGVIVNAEPIKTTLLDSGYNDPATIRVIYNGLDKETIVTLAQKQCPHLPFSFIVSSMGDLNSRKGFDMLLRGFAKFLQTSGADDACLVIIGEGGSRDDLHKLTASLHIEKHVLFTGFLDNPYPYLAASHVYATMSKNEGISNALLEAALLKNAVISTVSGGGIASVIREGDNGFLLPESGESRLAEILCDLRADPEKRKKVATAAASTMNTLFSMDTMKHDIISFFHELQARKTPHT